jgi:hypothetical protein
MGDLSKLYVYTASDGSNWIAATRASPYFCLQAHSDRDALALAARALEFYNTASSRPPLGRERERQSRFRYQSKISARELAIAFW